MIKKGDLVKIIWDNSSTNYEYVVRHVPQGEGDMFHLKHLSNGREIAINPSSRKFVGLAKERRAV